jgi:RNA polymerase sigma factor (sigma-70 family)
VTEDDFWDALTQAVPAARLAAAGVVGDGPDADDCVAAALESAAAGAQIDSPATWLATVARRRAVDLVRQREREQRAWTRLGRLQGRAEPDFADDVVEQETARWLAQEAAALPPRTQAVFARVRDGVPAKNVADEFGLTERSVESHVLRARRVLRSGAGLWQRFSASPGADAGSRRAPLVRQKRASPLQVQSRCWLPDHSRRMPTAKRLPPAQHRNWLHALPPRLGRARSRVTRIWPRGSVTGGRLNTRPAIRRGNWRTFALAWRRSRSRRSTGPDRKIQLAQCSIACRRSASPATTSAASRCGQTSAR